jgi:hypothetical protein
MTTLSLDFHARATVPGRSSLQLRNLTERRTHP